LGLQEILELHSRPEIYDHKPLIPLLNPKQLDDLPPRNLRFRVCINYLQKKMGDFTDLDYPMYLNSPSFKMFPQTQLLVEYTNTVWNSHEPTRAMTSPWS